VHGLRSLLHSAGDGFALAGEGNVYRVGLWLLAGVFIWSGLAKVSKPAVAALALADFRLIREARRRSGRAAGIAEVALALLLAGGALLGYPFSRGPLAAACLLLGFFCFLITRSLLAGERFPCACFGDAHSSLSALTLARTVCLALLAVALMASVPTSSHGLAPDEAALQLVVAAGVLAILVHAAHVVRLIKQTNGLLKPEVDAP